MAEIPTRVLGDGTSVPVLGFGTYPLRGDDGVRAIASALEVGYRHVDTAQSYGSERGVGLAVAGLIADLSDPAAFDFFRDGQRQAQLTDASVSLDRLARAGGR